MTLPGFTAETSLYKTSGYYRMTSARDRFSEMIYPAQLDRSGRIIKTACVVGTSCVPDPKNPSCRICTIHEEDCTEGLSWYVCDRVLPCGPMTTCEPDPLNQFCYNCTSIDKTCKKSTYQYCKGVIIPNKTPINVPDPVVGLTR
jgi:hypothetical protein